MRRALLLGGAALVIGAEIPMGCAGSFDDPSKISTLRIFAVEADKPYAQPGDTVTFKMSYTDEVGTTDAGKPRPVNVLWLGGCFDPDGDDYFGCYAQIAALFQSFGSGGVPADAPVAYGPELATFRLTLPTDIVSRRPVPPAGPHYGIAYVFFAACAGDVRLVQPEGTSAAQSFPVGCFDRDTNQRLGAESFVPGYTQIYSFGDGRMNNNPIVTDLTFDGASMDDAKPPTAAVCPLTDEERRTQGCSRQDPKSVCTTYDLEVIVPRTVADVDPDATSADGNSLFESVWVDYYAEGGDLEQDAKLIVDPTVGYQPSHATTWYPPDKPGLSTIWAVVHDSRGGANVIRRDVIVQ